VGSYELLRPNSLISYRSLRRMASALKPKKANVESAEAAEQPGEFFAAFRMTMRIVRSTA